VKKQRLKTEPLNGRGGTDEKNDVNICCFTLHVCFLCTAEHKYRKKGVLNGYPTVTVGKALENTFAQPKWSRTDGIYQ
jgi:hypothetical protein